MTTKQNLRLILVSSRMFEEQESMERNPNFHFRTHLSSEWLSFQIRDASANMRIVTLNAAINLPVSRTIVFSRYLLKCGIAIVIWNQHYIKYIHCRRATGLCYLQHNTDLLIANRSPVYSGSLPSYFMSCHRMQIFLIVVLVP